MATSTKKLSTYVIAGITMAVLIIAAMLASGVQIPSTNNSPNAKPSEGANPTANPTSIQSPNTPQVSNTGTLAVYIKDAPVELSKLEVTVNSLEVLGEGGWIKLNFTEGTESVSFDLLTLQEVAKDLSIAELPTGNYSKLRLHVSNALATFEDETTADLKVPSEKIDIIVKFDIEEGLTTQVLIDMTADHAVIANSHNLRPVIKATVLPPPAATPTPEETATPTPAETPIQSPLSTETPTESPSSTETPTSSPEETEQPTPTPTATPTPTVTPI